MCHGGIQKMAWKIRLMQNPKGKRLQTRQFFWQFLSQKQLASEISRHSAICSISFSSGSLFNLDVQLQRCHCTAKPALWYSLCFLDFPPCSKPADSSKSRQLWTAITSKVIKGLADFSESKMKWKLSMNVCGKINAIYAVGFKKA